MGAHDTFCFYCLDIQWDKLMEWTGVSFDSRFLSISGLIDTCLIKSMMCHCFLLYCLGESPSSSASDVDNLNNQMAVDKATFPRGTNTYVSGNQVISARTHPNLVRLLDFVSFNLLLWMLVLYAVQEEFILCSLDKFLLHERSWVMSKIPTKL